MKTIEISEDALNTMKQMVEKLDADNKMLIDTLKAAKQVIGHPDDAFSKYIDLVLTEVKQ